MLSVQEHDALTEHINISMGRCAQALSAMVGARVTLSVPELQVVTLKALPRVIADVGEGDIISVHQNFRGVLIGSALLLMRSEAATVLVDALVGRPHAPRRLLPSDHEALVEIGNILLNNVVGTFTNLLHGQVRLEVPHMHQSPARQLANIIQYELILPPDMVMVVVHNHMRVVALDLDLVIVVLMHLEPFQKAVAHLLEQLSLS